MSAAGLQPATLGGMVFFSSRRRHTRYWRDWSSDVCSSDLDDVARGGEWWRDPNASGPFVVEAWEPEVELRLGKIGRAACRGRGEISGGALSLKKKTGNRCRSRGSARECAAGRSTAACSE